MKMEEFDNEEHLKKKAIKVITFPVPLASLETNEYINTPSKNSREKIINQALELHSKGNISEAAKYYRDLISKGLKDHRVFSNFGLILKDIGKLKEAELSSRKAIELNHNDAISHSNLGAILKDLGKLKEAELFTRRAIELNPDFAIAYSNLGAILKDLGKLQDAEFSYLKAIELNPNFAEVYYYLSTLPYPNKNRIWKDKLFSKSILNNKSEKDQVDIYFARANILHKEEKYEGSSKYLKLANKLKLFLYPSHSDLLIKKSKLLLIESDKEKNNKEELIKYPESIFIVGIPRSGSSLLESILSMNPSVDDLGEIKLLEESFIEFKKDSHRLTLAEEYWKRIKDINKQSNITTNKNLYNYQYTGIISSQIPNAKIIHCFRNPLDNILSIYRAHFSKGNQYSSSLIDCAKVYLDQEEIMKEYKNRFRSKIYDLNYDSLVSNPNQEIKSLISWLGWEWNDLYLSPHLNPRSVSTRSSVQVRSPINSKSIGGWKNYKEMLQPAIEILSKADSYQELTSQLTG